MPLTDTPIRNAQPREKDCKLTDRVGGNEEDTWQPFIASCCSATG